MAEPARKFEQPHQRAARLHALALDEAVITEMIVRGFTKRQTCTPFHPPAYPGVSQWAETVAASRELLIPRGWSYSDANNLSLVISPDEKVAVAVSTGDDNTGRSEYRYGEIQPRTKHPKGSEMRSAVEANEPTTLFDVATGEPVKREVDLDLNRLRTWVLLLAMIEQEIRYELSLPKRQDKEGYVCEWSERIIFPAIAIDSLPSRNDDQDDDGGTAGIDVPVERI